MIVNSTVQPWKVYVTLVRHSLRLAAGHPPPGSGRPVIHDENGDKVNPPQPGSVLHILDLVYWYLSSSQPVCNI